MRYFFLALLISVNSLATCRGQDLNLALMESTYMIEGPTQEGTTLGTCFLLTRPTGTGRPDGQIVLVTAAHVLEGIAGEEAKILLRTQRGQPDGGLSFPPVSEFVMVGSRSGGSTRTRTSR
jgi:hypothetical protein